MPTLTNVHGDDAPSWSPDGRKIAFTSFRDGNWEIYVMNSDGSDQKRLTYNGSSDFHPIWSPPIRLENSPDTSPPTPILIAHKSPNGTYTLTSESWDEQDGHDLDARILVNGNPLSDFSTQRTFTYTPKLGSNEIVLVVRDSSGLEARASQTILTSLPSDTNEDGVVNIVDLINVARYFGQPSFQFPNADINRDGKINIADLVRVAADFGKTTNGRAAPSIYSQLGNLNSEDVAGWIRSAKVSDDGTPRYRQGVQNLEMIYNHIVPDKTELLQNYPNPFNPETWIPYQLKESSVVDISIYDIAGQKVRHLHLGEQQAGRYISKPKAAHWDGRNQSGEKVSSGQYFIEFQAGNYREIRRVVIGK